MLKEKWSFNLVQWKVLTNMDESKSNIGELFLELRIAKGWSLKEIEAVSGVPATYYHFVETTNKIPSLMVIKRLSITYGISPLVFFDAVNLPNNN